jgi:hypothetical protein
MSMAKQMEAAPAAKRTRGGVTLHYCLFLTPAAALEGRELPLPQALRFIGDVGQARMEEAATAAEKLAADGWRVTLHCHYLEVRHPRIATAHQARQRLVELGIADDEYLEPCDCESCTADLDDEAATPTSADGAGT